MDGTIKVPLFVAGHEGRRVDRAGAVLTDSRDLAILVHDRKAPPALGQDGMIHSNAHVVSSVLRIRFSYDMPFNLQASRQKIKTAAY